MLRFFRNIRNTLFMEGKAMRYLMYAVGEIVLISIGLLIALQLNNINDNRKAREYEDKMLHELHAALKGDQWYFNLLTDRLSWLDSSATLLLSLYDRDLEDLDTINRELRGLLYDIQIYYNRGAYEALKSSGLDKISNDTLRMALVQHYDFWVPRNETMIREDKAEKDIMERELNNQVFRTYLRRTEDGVSLGPPGIELRSAAMNHDERYLRLLMLKKGYAVTVSKRLDNIKKATDDILNRLEQELRIPKNETESVD